MFKLLLGYWFEALMGLVIFYIDFKWFCFYAFIMVLWNTAVRADYLRKLIRASTIANEIKILALMKKTKVEEEEVLVEFNKMKDAMTTEAWSELEKDLSGVLNVNNLK